MKHNLQHFNLIFMLMGIMATTLFSTVSGQSVTCIHQSPEDTSCIEWRYPHHSICSVYFQCSADCKARIRLCPWQNDALLHFSNATQNCELQSIANCTVNDGPTPTVPGSTVTLPPYTGTGTTPSVTATRSTSPVTTTRPSVPTIFCATAHSSQTVTSGRHTVDLTSTSINDGGAFDVSTDTFTPPSDGLYFLHISVKVDTLVTPGTGNVSLTCNNCYDMPTILRNDDTARSTQSRGVLNAFTTADRLTLSTSEALSSDPVSLVTSFSGFNLQDTMDPVAAFSVARTTSVFEDGPYYAIEMDKTLVDTHSSFYSDHYSIPIAGTWVITCHAASYPNSGFVMVVLEVTTATTRYNPYVTLSDGPTADTSSHTFIVSVIQGAVVTAEAYSKPIYSDASKHIALMGFLYSPRNSIELVAWSVCHSGHISYETIVPFNAIFVNQGNGYDTTARAFVAPQGGLYYITLTNECYTAMRLQLLVNNVVVAELHSDGTSSKGGKCTRAIILRLSAFDVVQVNNPPGSYLNGGCNGSGVLNNFGGFRITV